MKFIAALSISILLIAFSVQAQLSETALKYIKEKDIDSLLIDQLLPLASAQPVSRAAIQQRIENEQENITATLYPLLQSRFTTIDNEFQSKRFVINSPSFLNARKRYLSDAGDIIKTLINEAGQFKSLYSKDPNDRIISFYSEINVQADGKLLVKELITIWNGNGTDESGGTSYVNNDIQRGIVRDFPTSYTDKKGFRVTTGFTLKRVLLNNEEEPYVTELLSNGTRIKVGHHDIFLAEGEYTYLFEYETSRQLIFHPDKDELYWNVNGNGWVFSADTVSCMVHFPANAVIKEEACYTGLQGSTDKYCTALQNGNNQIFFSGTKKFQPYEGLTIAVSIEKGVITVPDSLSRGTDFFRANYIIPVLVLFLLMLSFYYWQVWKRKGKDPESGTVFPQFSPPEGLSPADVGYISEQKYGPHLFAAALIDIAVKKQLVIEVKEKGSIFKSVVYSFNRPGNYHQSIDTALVYGFNPDEVFGQQAQKGTYNSKLKGLNDSLRITLKNRFLIRNGKPNTWSGLFRLNTNYTIPGYLIIITSFVLGFLFIVTSFTPTIAVIVIGLILAIIAVHVFFSGIMSAYNSKGRAIADHIAGFRMYLETAEQHVYNQLAPPEKTLELFEKYLPYAIALKVENAWAEKFDGIMQHAIEEGYRPSYYSGSYAQLGRNFSMSGMSKGISAGLSSTISSASTPPSKSSGGSGGGGSSGGGGGGGGGGGW